MTIEVPTDPKVLARAKNTTLLCLDVDGIMTDGRLYLQSDGVEAKAFHIRDGLGLKLLMAGGVSTAIITGRQSPSAQARAAELGITYFHQGVADKRQVMHDLMAKMSVGREAVAFMGDDLPDLAALRLCGLAITVPEAPEIVRANTHYVTRCQGGHGAVREVCELILHAQGKLQAQLDRYLA